jgi:hypothetical protein
MRVLCAVALVAAAAAAATAAETPKVSFARAAFNSLSPQALAARAKAFNLDASTLTELVTNEEVAYSPGQGTLFYKNCRKHDHSIATRPPTTPAPATSAPQTRELVAPGTPDPALSEIFKLHR